MFLLYVNFAQAQEDTSMCIINTNFASLYQSKLKTENTSWDLKKVILKQKGFVK